MLDIAGLNTLCIGLISSVFLGPCPVFLAKSTNNMFEAISAAPVREWKTSNFNSPLSLQARFCTCQDLGTWHQPRPVSLDIHIHIHWKGISGASSLLQQLHWCRQLFESMQIETSRMANMWCLIGVVPYFGRRYRQHMAGTARPLGASFAVFLVVPHQSKEE